MNRDGFRLGFLATGGQVLLLREMVAVFGGSELFVGSALAGWMTWVAVGAWFGGHRRPSAEPLFVVGVLLIPLSLIATRLSPLVFTDVVGEMVPLTTATVLSILLMAPVGLVSGLLFPTIARKGDTTFGSVVAVYLFEGVGAFAAGIVVVLLVGGLASNMGVGLTVGAMVMAGGGLGSGNSRWPAIFVAVVLLAILGWTGGGDRIDVLCDRERYPDYKIQSSFDTHYGHQTLFFREGTTVLLTDNTVEAFRPAPETVENLFLPPLIYRPDARSVLFIGRAEFGVGQLAREFPDIHLVAVDPRATLTDELGALFPDELLPVRVNDDPAAFLAGSPGSERFDIIILNPGSFDSYRNSRFVTAEFLQSAQARLSEGGVFFLPTRYDTDRYISVETTELLAIIYRTLRETFENVTLWPGTRTLFLASNNLSHDIPVDSVVVRATQLACDPEYVNEDYLYERLSEFKVDRLREAVAGGALSNSISRPLLATLQSWYRAKASDVDRLLLEWGVRSPYWLIAIPILIMAFLWLTLRRREGRDRFGLFLYFVAGLTSLSLELVAFYTYQSTVGSLYSELAVLIGTFMLGLAVGTYLSSRSNRPGVGRLSLATLMAAGLVFLFTWTMIDGRTAFIYHGLFILVVALATGSLFVAATRRYYADTGRRNRGAGYACELIGSALGALLTVSVLLPAIGLTWLIVSLVLFLAIALVVCFRASISVDL